MAFVGDVWFSVFTVALYKLPAEVGDPFRDQRFGERDDFNWDRELPQDLNLLGGVCDDDELLGGGGDDLLAQHGATSALDEVEGGVEFVRAVDGDIDLLGILEGDQWNSKLGGEIACSN